MLVLAGHLPRAVKLAWPQPPSSVSALTEATCSPIVTQRLHKEARSSSIPSDFHLDSFYAELEAPSFFEGVPRQELDSA